MKEILIFLMLVAASTAQYQRPQENLYYGQQPAYIREPSKKGSNRRTPATEKFDDYGPVTDFSWNLFQKLANIQDNIVLSAFSVQILLSYLSTAAVGQTKDQIIQAIAFRNPNQLDKLKYDTLQSTGNREFQFANFLLYAENLELNETFRDNLINRDVDVFPVDFRDPRGVQNLFEKYVGMKTKGTIRGQLSSVSPSTRMLLSNVIYFNGKWKFEFDNAGFDNFFFSGGVKPINFMKLQKKLKWGEIKSIQSKWVELPYNSYSESMIILAPDNGDVNGLINQLKNRDFAELIEAADGDNYANVSLTMPKFSIQSTTSLISGLRELGIRDLFSQHAQLPFVSTKENVQVSDVQQQSKLEVNEKGTIAASITTFSVVALSYSPPLPNVNILVNKPFLAIVVEKANKIPLFISKISRPE